MNENLKSTKFIVSMAVLVLSFILTILKMIDALEWFKWAISLVGIYTAGNVASKVIKKESAD